MDVNNIDSKGLKSSDELIKIVILSAGFLLLIFWFWTDYSLFLQPIKVQAQIVSVEKYSFEYKFYDSITDKTLNFRREISPSQAQMLRKQSIIDVIYPATNHDKVVIPSIQRPLPVWVFFGIHMLCLWALIRSIRDFGFIRKLERNAL